MRFASTARRRSFRLSPPAGGRGRQTKRGKSFVGGRDLALKLGLGAGVEGVAGVYQASRRGPLSLLKRRLAGGVGIDTNDDHRALGKLDHFGNLVRICGFRLDLDGKRAKRSPGSMLNQASRL
ncbi:hypothetical protein MPNT_70052 [Candidatus Methylacidithermus pantelleriae]|uniref:Uncharacterized protein n=1 Tax=Candidatus Methylacidithermus pantelleriae TaxID=2744239 RepID=A0A8J2BVP5_9BACT|nr:hypothetical protein MPNT_70052 [Candidatus Methylacidithermus pantelleriae]